MSELKRSSDCLRRVEEVGADDGKVPGAGTGAEAARGFLLELGHAQVTFGLVVVEGNTQVGEEAQDLIAALA